MADQEGSLRITIDVNTSTLRALGDEQQRIKTAFKDMVPTPEAVEAYQSSVKELSGRMKELTNTHGGFQREVRAARVEARMFRFAVTELIAGIDGLANAYGGLTGAGDAAQKSIKEYAGAVKDALGAGIGLKFGLDAIGMPGAGALAVMAAGMVFLGDMTKKARQEMELLAQQAAKPMTAAIPGMSYSDLKKDQEDAQRKLEQAQSALAQVDRIYARTGAQSGAEILMGVNKELAQDVQNKQAVLNVLGARMKALTEEPAAMLAEIDKEYKLGEMSKEKYANQLKVLAAMPETLRQSNLEAEIKGKLADLEEKRAKQGEKDAADYEKWMDKRLKALLKFGTVEEDYAATGKTGVPRAESELNPMKPGEVAGVSVSPLRLPSKEELQTGKEELQKWTPAVSALQYAFSGVGDAIKASLVDRIGQAHSLFQIFIMGALEGLEQYLVKLLEVKAIGALLNIFSPGLGTTFETTQGFASGGIIPEPVYGVGMISGRGYSFGESGSERVSPMYGSPDRGGYSPGGGEQHVYHHLSGETAIKDGHIMIAWKQDRLIDRKLGGNV